MGPGTRNRFGIQYALLRSGVLLGLLRLTLMGLTLMGLTLMVLASGCMSYRLHRVKDLGPLPKVAEGTSKVHATYQALRVYQVLSDGLLIGTSGPPTPALQTGEDLRLARVLDECGYFYSFVAAPAGGDLHLTVELVISVPEYNSWNDLNFFSVRLIPMWRTETYDLKVEARRRDGVTRTYQLRDQLRVVHWMPLLFAAPFAGFQKPAHKMEENLYRAVVRKLVDDGMLPVQAPGGS